MTTFTLRIGPEAGSEGKRTCAWFGKVRDPARTRSEGANATPWYDQKEVTLKPEESKLVSLINDYRQSKGLPAIPLSPRLTYVAQSHAWDVAANNPDQGSCNIHSWSGSPRWTPCCYTPDHKQIGCTTAKPEELTGYMGNGYEICQESWDETYDRNNTRAVAALKAWKSSPPP